MLREVHRRGLALQLAVVRVVRASAAFEEQLAKVIRETAVVVLQYLLGQLGLAQSPHPRTVHYKRHNDRQPAGCDDQLAAQPYKQDDPRT